MATNPTPDITQSAESLRQQAVSVQTSTPTPSIPETTPTTTPSEPEWGNLQKHEDGNFSIKLTTGEEFKGKAEDILPILAKSKWDSSTYAKDLKTKLDAATPPQAQQATQQLQADLTTATTDAEKQAAVAKYYEALSTDPRQFTLSTLADALGFDSPDEFKEFATGLYKNTQATNSNGVIDQFLSKAPDFPVSNDNLVKLGDFMDANGIPFSVAGLRAGHALAIQEKVYTPRSEAEIQATLSKTYSQQTGVKPPPIPTATASTTTAPSAPEFSTAKLEDLRKAAMEASKR
jgi:hypothetical protein